MMVSEFIREQKRYTRDELKSIFSSGEVMCSDSDIVRIIKKLKGYGIIKVVNVSDTAREMTDLDDSDIEVVDEDNPQKKYYYVFTFVGIIIVEGRVLKCYPKYIIKNDHPVDELKQIIKVLNKYNSRKQIIQMYNNSGSETTFNRLAVIMYLLNDYYENGIYTNTEDIIETNGMGEVNWDRTINNTYPIIEDELPYYVELQTRRRINDDNDFFTRLHESVLTVCSKELSDADLLKLLDIEGVSLTDFIPEDLGDEEYILNRLEKEKNIQFNTRKQIVLQTLESIIRNKSTIDNLDTFSLFGSNSFNIVWEKVCADVFDNSLNIRIKDLGIENITIPENANYSVDNYLISVIEKPIWCGKTSENEDFSIEADKTLIPDMITVYKRDNKCDFIIFDAKYYNIQLEKDKLAGTPGVEDVTKQYLYQLAYKDFIEANRHSIDKVYNCFLMPTEQECEKGVIKKGYVKMNMLSVLGLEQIQVILLSAKEIFSYYLSRRKYDISQLELE